VVLAAGVAGGCGSDDSSKATLAASTLAASTIAATTTDEPSTTVACRVFTATDAKSDGFPGTLSGLVGSDVRLGSDPCHERFVLELKGTGGFPGWWVRYESPPLTDDPRGEPVDVAGSAFIVVTVESWMTNMEGEGYHGPTRITPTNVSHIKELVMLGDFEGVTLWAIGLDQRRPFEVSTLTDPPRLVVDIASA
jgi:hypothetical protein